MGSGTGSPTHEARVLPQRAAWTESAHTRALLPTAGADGWYRSAARIAERLRDRVVDRRPARACGMVARHTGSVHRIRWRIRRHGDVRRDARLRLLAAVGHGRGGSRR